MNIWYSHIMAAEIDLGYHSDENDDLGCDICVFTGDCIASQPRFYDWQDIIYISLTSTNLVLKHLFIWCILNKTWRKNYALLFNMSEVL